MKRATLFAALIACSCSAAAQEHCNASDTRLTCADKVQQWIDEQDGTQRDAEFQALGERLQATSEERNVAVPLKNTGEGSPAGMGAASATNDFLPLLRALVNTGSGGLNGDDGEGIGLEWSNPLGLPAEHQNKVAVALRRSEAYEPLKDALRAASLDDRIDAVDEDIDEGDDALIGISYSRASQRSGRDPDLHEDLYSSLLQIANVPAEMRGEARQRRRDLERELGLPLQAPGTFEEIFSGAQFAQRADREQLRDEYIRAVEEEIVAQFASLSSLLENLSRVGFYGLHDLVNNQPQLSVSANYRSRDDIVGPDEFTASISYEMGWYNVNTFRRYAERCGDLPALCLADYLSRSDVAAGLASSPRISFKLEYTDRKRVAVGFQDAAFSYVEDPEEQLTITATYARLLGRETATGARSRVDVSLSYEDFSDDPLRHNRGVATATLTYPVSSGLYLSIGAVYATKPEFRGDVDSELGARAGFIYKVLREE